MFKLIASDMDGTLLDENGQVPPETYELILALHEHGVHFAASSGRRYDRLCEFFAPVRDKMDFVAANGAQVYADGKMVDREVYSHLAIRRLAQAVRTFPNLHLALFDRTKSFLLDDECKFVREVDKDLPNAERIWELPDPSVNIIKASIFCDDSAVMDSACVLQRELGQLFTFAPSGNAWIDAMQPGVSKASGIAQLMEHYGVERDEVMAFDAIVLHELCDGKRAPRAQGSRRSRGGVQPRPRRPAGAPSRAGESRLIRQMGTFLFCRQWGTVLAAFSRRLSPTTSHSGTPQ